MGFMNSAGYALRTVTIETLVDLALELGLGDFCYLLEVDPFNTTDYNEVLRFLVERGYSIGKNYQVIPVRELGEHTVYTVAARTRDGLALLDNRKAFYQVALGILRVVLIELIVTKLSS